MKVFEPELSDFDEFIALFSPVYAEVAATSAEPWPDVIAESVARSLGVPFKRQGKKVELRNRKRYWNLALRIGRDWEPRHGLVANAIIWR